MNLLSILTIVCITLFGLFGAFTILTKKGDRQANILLGSFFILWAIDFLDGLLMLSGFYLNHSYLALWSESFVFLYGPILYFYSNRILYGRSILKWNSIFHLIAFILSAVLISGSFHMLANSEKLEILKRIVTLEQSPKIYAIGALVAGHFLFYIYLCKRQLSKAEQRLSKIYSNYNLTWLNTILNSFIIILGISLIGNILQINQSNIYFEVALPILIIVMLIFIVSIFWKSLKEPFIWLEDKVDEKYAKTSIVDSEKQTILEKINKALDEDKIYLNSELMLSDLSESIGYSSRKVSQVINEMIQKSFFELINSYRIEAAKSKFIESKDKKLTILEVMYSVGFNSKSSFNTQFKKHMGQTPSQFIKSIQSITSVDESRTK